MTREELNILLHGDDYYFRKAAIDEIVLTFPEHADLFFAGFAEDEVLAKQIANAAKQWLPYLRDGYAEMAHPLDVARSYATFADLAEQYVVFLREMRAYLASQDAATAQRIERALGTHFPGLRAELPRQISLPQPDLHRQLMVFVTGRCNLHCPYCFSKELQRMSISREDMSRILDWAQRCGVASLLPCGGEPLLYEHMDWLVQEIEKRGMTMYFASNLTVPISASLLASSVAINQLHVHLTEEIFRGERLMSVFRENLRQCCDKGVVILLRGNICSDNDLCIYDRWFEIARDFALPALNVAFTIPSHTGANCFVAFEAIQPMMPHLRYIWNKAKEQSIRLSIAKPIPVCLLPDDIAQDVLRTNLQATYCNIGEDSGMHNLSLSTDMRFSPCLGVDEPSVAFSDDLEWDALQALFGPTVTDMQAQPLFEKCHDCFLYARRLCQGACLSYKQTSRNGGHSCAD